MSDYLQTAKEEIKHWENEGPGFLSQVGDFVLWPAQKIAETLIPDGVQERVGAAVESALRGLGAAANYTINQDEVRERVRTYRSEYGDELKARDETAKHYWNWHLAYAAGEGAVLGAGGIVTLAADIPAIFTIQFRLIQEIALCYGYDIDSDKEKEYVMQILRVGSASDLKAKIEFVITLKQIEELLIKVTWKKMTDALFRKEISQMSLLAAIKQFAKSLGIIITKRKALQMVPVIGAIVGACFNYSFTYDIGHAAYMCYRRRKINEGSDTGNVGNEENEDYSD